MKTLFFTLTLVACAAVSLPAATLKQTVASINADAQKEGGPAKVLQSISSSTKVPVATLEKEKASHPGLTYGDLFAAHTIAKSSGKTFAEVAAMKEKGQNWDQIAETLGMSTDSSKKTTSKTAPKASPTPSAPAKTLRQEQNDRYK